MMRGLLLVEMMRPKSPGLLFEIFPLFGSMAVAGTALKLLIWVGKVHVIEEIEKLRAELDVLRLIMSDADHYGTPGKIWYPREKDMREPYQSGYEHYQSS